MFDGICEIELLPLPFCFSLITNPFIHVLPTGITKSTHLSFCSSEYIFDSFQSPMCVQEIVRPLPFHTMAPPSLPFNFFRVFHPFIMYFMIAASVLDCCIYQLVPHIYVSVRLLNKSPCDRPQLVLSFFRRCF